MALITATEAKIYLPHLSGTDEDTNLDTLITRAGTLLAEWCGYPPASVGAAPTMESAAYTRYYPDEDGLGVEHLDDDEEDARILVLDVYPVTTITTIHDDTNWDWGSSYLVDSSDYIQMGDHGERVTLTPSSAHGSWSTDTRAIKAVYTAGWATVPELLKQACALTVRHWYDLREHAGKQSVNIGGVSASQRPETLPDSVTQILSAFRLGRILL